MAAKHPVLTVLGSKRIRLGPWYFVYRDPFAFVVQSLGQAGNALTASCIPAGLQHLKAAAQPATPPSNLQECTATLHHLSFEYALLIQVESGLHLQVAANEICEPHGPAQPLCWSKSLHHYLAVDHYHTWRMTSATAMFEFWITCQKNKQVAWKKRNETLNFTTIPSGRFAVASIKACKACLTFLSSASSIFHGTRQWMKQNQIAVSARREFLSPFHITPNQTLPTMTIMKSLYIRLKTKNHHITSYKHHIISIMVSAVWSLKCQVEPGSTPQK